LADAPAVIVSDIHCRPFACPAREVAEIARGEGARTLFVLGDLFDDLHRPLSRADLAHHLARAFGRVSGLEVVYLTSASSHDPCIREPTTIALEGGRVHVYPGSAIVRVGGLVAFMTHGDIAMRNGAHAFLVNYLLGLLGEELFLERRLRRRLGLPPDWWLFMGHTHIAGIDYRSKVANPGSWRESWINRVPYWRPPSYTYLLISSGGIVELKRAKRFLRGRRGAAQRERGGAREGHHEDPGGAEGG